MHPFSYYLRKNAHRLNRNDENNLMRIISVASSLDMVSKEITSLYLSVSFSAWAKLVRMFIPPRKEEHLEDPFAEGWKKTLEKRRTYKQDAHAFNWILTIMVNTARNIFDSAYERLKLNEKKSTDDDSQALILIDIQQNLPSVYSLIDYEQIFKLVQDALNNEMSAKEKRAFTLWFSEENTQQEIAEILDCSVGTVNTLIKHARNKIKYHLEKNNVRIEDYV